MCASVSGMALHAVLSSSAAGRVLGANRLLLGREQAAVLVRDVVFNILDGCLVTNSLQNSHKTGLVILK